MAVAELAEIWKEEQIRTFSLADDEFQFYQAQAKYNLADKLSELFKRPSLRKDLS